LDGKMNSYQLSSSVMIINCDMVDMVY